MTDSLPTIVRAIGGGQFDEAERDCRLALAQHPRDENLLVLLAISLQAQGRPAEALAVYRSLIEYYPASSTHWCNYGSALVRAGSGEEAEQAFATAMRLDPRNAGARLQLGLVRIEQRRYQDARDLLLDAFELDRDLPLARIHAARACALCQDFQGAEDLVAPWRMWLPLRDDHLQLELARLLLLMGDAPSTCQLLEDLVPRRGAYPESAFLLAHVYERLNRLAEAQTLADSLMAPDAPLQGAERAEMAHIQASLAMRQNQPAAARVLLEGAGPRHDHDYTHYFELAKACDKVGDTAAALRALSMAHARQVEDLQISSPELFEDSAAAMPAAVPRVSPEEYARWPQLISPATADSPVFIVGFPRSGTTLLEQMLDAHPQLQSMDENPFFNRLADKLRRHDPRLLSNLDALGQSDCDELRKQYLLMVTGKVARRWDARLVDKNPLNLLWLPMIHRLYPNARIILALRHPCDVVLSCYMQNFRASILGAACATLERLSRAYVQSMEYWLADVQLMQPHVLVSRYEDLVGNFEGQTGRIARFLELADPSPMLRFDQHARDKGYIATPSYSQVIEPVNRKGLHRWLRYREAFEPVLPILEPMLRHWGYTT